MNKKTLIIGICLVGILLVSVCLAGSGFSWSRVESMVADKMFGKIQNQVSVDEVSSEPVFGASASTLNQWTDQSGLVTYVMSGSFADATTTIVSVLNPFFSPTSTTPLDVYKPESIWNTTSTVNLVNLSITGVSTSSMTIICGADDNGYFDSNSTAPRFTILSTGTIATGTIAMFENNMDRGSGVVMTGSTTKILITGDYPYVMCYATGTATGLPWWKSLSGGVTDAQLGITAGAKGLMGANNTFEGQYKIRFTRNQY